MEKAALYCRVSTENQDIEPQKQKLKKWTVYKDLEYNVFKDPGVSAIADKRPGFEKMMENIEQFDAVSNNKT